MIVRSLLFVVLCCIPAVGAAQDRTPKKVDDKLVRKLIAQLDDDLYRYREKAQRRLIELGPDVEGELERALKQKPTLEAEQRLRRILSLIRTRFEAAWPGWNWIYQSTGRSQRLKAVGRSIDKLHLRVAKLNDNTPEADLEVEIRDATLKKVYAHGFISRQKAGRQFDWHQVDLKHRAKLTPGQTYVILFHSQDTSNTKPWVVNQVYRSVYPDGNQPTRELWDYFFRLQFKNGRSIHVGPPMNAAKVAPFASGNQGGTPLIGPLSVGGFYLVPPAERVSGEAEGQKPR